MIRAVNPVELLTADLSFVGSIQHLKLLPNNRTSTGTAQNTYIHELTKIRRPLVLTRRLSS